MVREDVFGVFFLRYGKRHVWWLWYGRDVFGVCGTGKDAFVAVSRPTEVLLSDEMDGKITLKSGIPSFCYLLSSKMDGKGLFLEIFPYTLIRSRREEAVYRDFPVQREMF